MTEEILEKFFYPRSLAIIGATRTPGFGFGIPGFLKRQGWLERTYLVNPKGGEIEGRKVYTSIEELPEGIDLAVVMVRAELVPGVLAELGRKGIRRVVIESAGFAEIGEKKRQEELLEVAREYGIRIIGPNCVGVVNTENRFATIEVIDKALEPGGVGIIAQSGVFGNILLDHLPSQGIKIAKVATLGNKIDLDEADFLEYFAQDERIRVIMIYQEGVKEGRRFISAVKSTCRKKPVVILKSGRTPFGSGATLSHTGSLSGEDRIYDGAYQQAGAIRAENLQEMLAMVRALSSQPAMKGKKVGIITTSGSLGAMCADAIYQLGLELAEWSPDTIRELKKIAPSWVNIKNPLDVGPSGIFPQALKIILQDPNPDGYILIPVVPFGAIEIWRRLGLQAEMYFGNWKEMLGKIPDKPVLAILLGYPDFIEELKELAGERITTYSSPELAVKSLWALYQARLCSDFCK